MTKENASTGKVEARDTSESLINPTVTPAHLSRQNEPPARLRYRGKILDEPAQIGAERRRYILDVAANFPDRRAFKFPWLYVQRDQSLFVLWAPRWPKMGRGPGFRYSGHAVLPIGDELQAEDIVTT